MKEASLANWTFLGVLLAALVSFVVYTYWSIEPVASTGQLSAQKYVPPKLQQEAPVAQQPGSKPQYTANPTPVATETLEPAPYSESPSSAMEAPDPTSYPVSTPWATQAPDPTSLSGSADSRPLDPRLDQVAPTETLLPEGTSTPSKPTPKALPVQSTSISTPSEECTAGVGCADPSQPLTNQITTPRQNSPSCTRNNGKAPCATKKVKEKTNDKSIRRLHPREETSP